MHLGMAPGGDPMSRIIFGQLGRLKPEKIEKIKSIFQICDPSHDPITDYVKDADI